MGKGLVRPWFGLVALCLAAAGCAGMQQTLKNDPLLAKLQGGGRPAGSPTPKATANAAATPENATKSASEKARDAVDAFSDDDERALGEAVALRIIATTMNKQVTTPGGRVRQSAGLELRDETLLAYVNHVGNLVALQGERQPVREGGKLRMKARRFTFAVLDTDEVGAYSTPGGYIFVTRGLLQKLTSESELAWVLGHEIAHVDYEDGLTALKADIMAKAYVGGITDSLDFSFLGQQQQQPGAKRDPAKEQAAFNALVDRFYDLYEGTGLARESEQRADERGLDYSTRAGYDGRGGERALAALAPPEGGPMLGRALGDRINRVVTHGSKGERMAEMRAHLDKPGVTGAGRYDRVVSARLEQLASRAP
jgi:predicted Zn-dependent protease